MRDSDKISRREIEDELGLKESRVTWLQAHDIDFPPVVEYTPMGRLYSRAAIRAYKKTRKAKRGRQPAHDRAFYVQVGQLYRQAKARRQPTTLYIAAELKGSYRQASRWVAKARDLGLLE